MAYGLVIYAKARAFKAKAINFKAKAEQGQ